MISDRYLDDGIAEWEMNPVRLKYRQQLLDKINQGIYRTEKVETCLCGSRSFERLSEKDRFGLPFGTSLCRDCGQIVTTPRLALESLPAFYDQDYHALVFGFEDVQDLEYLVNKNQGYLIFNFVKKFLKPKVPLKVAEIGCGVGHNLRIFREEAAKIGIEVEAFGCEYSGASVAYGREKLGLTLFQGGVEALREAGVRFDILILSHVLEHFSDPREEVSRIGDLLEETGLVYIEVPGVMEIHHKPEYQCDYLKYSVCAHMYNFSLGTLQNLMEGSGFELVAGNETIRSIFALNRNVQGEHRNYYHRTLAYLEILEEQKNLFNEHCQSRNQLQTLQGLVNSLQGSLNQALEAVQQSSLEGDEDMRAGFEALVKIVEEVQREKTDLTLYYREETARLNATIATMSDEAAVHRERLGHLGGELEVLRQVKAGRKESFQEEVVRLNEAIQKLGEGKAVAQSRATDFANELDAQHRVRLAMEQAAHQEMVARLNERLNDLVAAGAEDQSRLADLTGKLEAQYRDQLGMEQTHAEMVARLNERLNDLVAAGAEDQSRLAELTVKLDAQHRDQLGMEQTHAEMVARLNERLKGLAETGAEDLSRLADLTVKLDAQHRDQLGMEQTHAEMVARLNERLNGLVAAGAEDQSRLTLLTGELEALRRGKEEQENSRRQEVGSLSLVVDGLRREKAAMAAAHQQEVTQLTEANRRLQAEKDKVDGELDQLLHTLRTR